MYNHLPSIISYYVQRQSIVMLAMLELNPLSLTLGGDSCGGINLKPYVALYSQKEYTIGDKTILYKGVWKNEWDYKVHGIGCRLTHKSTKEPLEWDAPDLKAFRLDWFWRHLLWRCKFENSDPYINIVKDFVMDIDFNQMEQDIVRMNIVTISTDGLMRLA